MPTKVDLTGGSRTFYGTWYAHEEGGIEGS